MHRLDRRLAKLEADSGLTGNPYEHMSDAELDEELARSYGVLAANLSLRELEELDCYVLADLDPEPVLESERKFLPMSTDIQALGLKRAGRKFYDECADLSIEQIEARVNAHIARCADTVSPVTRALDRWHKEREVVNGQEH